MTWTWPSTPNGIRTDTAVASVPGALARGRQPVLSAITWTAASPISRWNCWDGCGDRVLCFPCAEVFALSKVAWL